ncbi:MAG: recombinase family protein [Thomasclavelia sp.]
MVQSRWKKLSYNSKKLVELPPSSWIIVKNTHEPIVSQELFDAVQQELSKYHKISSSS